MHMLMHSDFHPPPSTLPVVTCCWAQCNGIRAVAGDHTHLEEHTLCCCVAPMQRWGYQDLQAWQDSLIKQVEDGPLALLLEKVQGTAPSS